MITIHSDRTIFTGYYKSPVIHNVVDGDKIVVSIRKATIENIDKNIDQSVILNELPNMYTIDPVQYNYPLEDTI